MSTKILRGHVNTISEEVVAGRRRRRTHSAEFKARVVAACRQPGVSIAAVAMAHGVNANLARRWVVASEHGNVAQSTTAGRTDIASLTFVPLQVSAGAEPTPQTSPIHIELRRGATAITVSWPCDAAAQCAAWMRELLR